jgi:putative membrane-bound dehydrogenase-like protein
MKATHLALLLIGASLLPAPCSLLLAADAKKLESKTTYAKAYGATKGEVIVDPAKDLPRYPAVEPKDALATWQVKKGYKLQLAAHEPQVRSPIALSFDERGRMFACEMIDYSEMRDVTPHLGRISMLEDKDGDGVYETSTVFADNLAWPTGVIWANGGIFVIATPDIFFFKDTDGDNKADVREVVFTGLGTGLKILNVQGLANCPQWGLDNRIHIQCGGGNRGKVKCLKRPDLPEIEIGGRDLWFDPRTFDFGLEAGGAQYGMSFDNYGRKYACSNSDHLQFFVCDDRYAERNAFFDFPRVRQSVAVDGGAAEVFRLSPDEPWRIIRTRWRIAGVVKGAVEGGGRVSGYFTGATGTTVYRGDALGPEFVGNTFSGDAGGQLVHRKLIVPDGVSVKGMRPADEQGFEFAASKDTWVRVVNFSNAPDGCLHICDMYREVIEHPWSIPDEIKKHVDLNNGNNRGRIYRIVADQPDWKRRPSVDLSKATTEELVATLAHDNGWHRDAASRLLYERNDKAAVPLLEKLAGESPSALGRLHALSALEGFGEINRDMAIRALGDADEQVRARAIRLSERVAFPGAPVSVLQPKLARLIADSSPAVRIQLALTLGGPVQETVMTPRDFNSKAIQVGGTMGSKLGEKSDTVETLIALARKDAGDPWISSAILSAHPSFSSPVLKGLSQGEVDSAFQARLLTVVSAQKNPEEIKEIIDWLAAGNANPPLLTALSQGLKRAGTTIAKVDTENKLAAVFTKAAATADDAQAGTAPRLEALSLLSLATFKQAQPALLACLAKDQPAPIQSAAVTALGQFNTEEVAQALLEHWPHLTPKARESALTQLLARPDRTHTLLKKVTPDSPASPKPSDFTASQVQSLIKHEDKSIADLAKTALASVIPPSRESVLAKFQPAIAGKGDFAKGQVVFLQRCLACHRAEGQGIPVGPDFVTVKTKGRDALLTAILDPHKEVAPQFIAYTVNTKDGQTLAGIVTKDDASSMTIKLMGGVEMNFPRANIKGSTSIGQSLMPEGLETGMTVQDMADLLTFIEQAK